MLPPHLLVEKTTSQKITLLVRLPLTTTKTTATLFFVNGCMRFSE